MRHALFLFAFLVAFIARSERFAVLITKAVITVAFSATQSLAPMFRVPVALYVVNSIDVGLKKEHLQDVFLEAFKGEILALTAFATDFSSAVLDKEGDKVKVGYIPLAAAAQDFKGSYTTQATDWEVKEVSVDRHKFVSWGLSDTDIFTQGIVNLESQARMKAHTLAAAVVADVLSCVTAANFGAALHTGLAGAFDLDDIADMRTGVVKAKWPKVGRSMILGADYYGAVVKDNAMQDASAAGGTETRTSGVLPSLYTFGMIESEEIPANAENLIGLATLPSAIAVAMRYLAPRRPEKYIEARAITDPLSKITIGFRHDYDTHTGVETHVYECNYGFDPLEAAALKRMVSA